MRELIDRKIISNFDWQLFLLILTISFIGVLLIYSSSSTSESIQSIYKTPYGRQMTWILLGSLLLFLTSAMDYHIYARLSYIIYISLVLMLVSVFFFGYEAYGAKRWINLSFFKIQPAEFAKLSIILILSRYFSSKRDLTLRFVDIFFSAVVVAIPFFLILKEPDLGTAVLLLPIFVFYLFMGRKNLKYFMVFILMSSLLAVFMWYNIKDYQKLRIKAFLNPDYDKLGAGYQIVQSKIAVGSGGLIGKGFKAGTQAQLDFLPAQHTDFIFSVLAEEFGFLGSCILLLLFLLLLLRGLKICMRAKDNLAIFLGSGILFVITMNLTINIFVVLGLFPVTGLPLPLVSYGGSSLLTTMVCFGIIESIRIHRFHF